MAPCRVLIRSYRYGDEPQIKKLINEATMATVWPFFFASARKELISQLILLLAAVLFVVIGTPLHYRYISAACGVKISQFYDFSSFTVC